MLPHFRMGIFDETGVSDNEVGYMAKWILKLRCRLVLEELADI